MVRVAAVVPAAPLLVPRLCTGRAAESEPMRAACLRVTAALAEAADRWLVIGASDAVAPGERLSVPRPLAGSFIGFGVDVPVAMAPAAQLAEESPFTELPLPLLIAGWLRGQVAERVVATGELVSPRLPTERCRKVGAELAAVLAAAPEPVGVLVVGDGATTHTEKAPGYLDRRAGPFDATAAEALAGADPHRLLALDADLADELHSVGRAPWQVLAGLALELGGAWRGELYYSDAPYGVGYHVALWQR